MNRIRRSIVGIALAGAGLSFPLAAEARDAKLTPFAPLSVADRAGARDVTLAAGGAAAPIYIDAADAAVVRIAADAFAGDVERVASVRPVVSDGPPRPAPVAVFFGTIGSSRLIDDLIRAGKLDVAAGRGGGGR
jgi:hypothetical protein